MQQPQECLRATRCGLQLHRCLSSAAPAHPRFCTARGTSGGQSCPGIPRGILRDSERPKPGQYGRDGSNRPPIQPARVQHKTPPMTSPASPADSLLQFFHTQMLLPRFGKQMGYVKKVLFDLCDMAMGSINTLYRLLLFW